MKAKRLAVEEDLMKTSWGWAGQGSAWIEVELEDDTDWILKLDQLVFSLAMFDHFHTFPGLGWVGWGKIEIKDHLSPAEADIRAELGKSWKKKRKTD